MEAKKKDDLADVSIGALLVFALSGGCDGDPGVSDKAVLAYVRGIESDMSRRKKEGA